MASAWAGATILLQNPRGTRVSRVSISRGASRRRRRKRHRTMSDAQDFLRGRHGSIR